MIQINNLNKSFGSQVIFEDVSLAIHPGERLGLVGRNGHGKTTLLRMIMGLEETEAGTIQIPKNYRLGYLTQRLEFAKDTILEEVARGLPARQKTETWRAEKILAGLGFRPADMSRHPDEFSGGFQVRLNLAKVLVASPDLLLLDEPTNYLDVVSIRWLAGHLRQWKGELCLITHDRSFMDGVVTHVAAIHRHKVRKVKGTTTKLYDLIEQEEEIHEKTRVNQEKRIKEAEDYIARFRAKARLATNVQSRMKALAKMDRRDKLSNIKTLSFSFGFAPMPAKILLSTSGLSFGYTPARTIIDDFNLAVGRRDRICVIGHNGQGKTTLLRLLAGDLTPGAGEIHLHNKAALGYFAQTNIADLNPAWTVEQEFMNVGCERQRARAIAGAMMFEGEAAEKKTEVLSGGERSRVLLGKVLAQASNLLLLDEPTNHLDMQSADAFLEAVDSFPGAVVMVTHNEMFLHRLANRFIVFQNDEITYFEGSYQDFLDQVGWSDEQITSTGSERPGPKPDDGQKGPSRKELRRMRAALVTETSRQVKPLKTKLDRLEQDIIEAEERLQIITQEMIDISPATDGKKFGELSREHQQLTARIEILFDKLDRVSKEHDRQAAAVEAKLKALDEQAGGKDT